MKLRIANRAGSTAAPPKEPTLRNPQRDADSDSDGKPKARAPLFENVPQALRLPACWVLWRYEKTAKGNFTKVPYSVNGGHASTTDATTWATFDEAREAYEGNGADGIGLVLVDDFVGIDFDHV